MYFSFAAILSQFRLPALVILVVLLAACSKETTSPTDPLVVPNAYDGSNYAANSTAAMAVRTNYAALAAKLKTARDVTVTLDAAELASLYASNRPLTAIAFQGAMDMHLSNAAKASRHIYNPNVNPSENGDGGVYGSFYFDKYGRDIEEHIQKGLFATLFYNQALALVNDGVSVADVDQIVALWGATPSFKNTDKATTDADVYCAAYAARRDKNDGKGLYTDMKKALIKAQAAVKAGSNYNTELNEAIANIKLTWEKSQMATAINYLYSVIGKLSATTMDDAARASAIHSFGEASGILVAWNALSSNQRKISDAQLAELLALIHMTPGEEPTCHVFWQDAFTNLPNLAVAIENLQSIYGFSNQEMEDFKKNWVSEQTRQ